MYRTSSKARGGIALVCALSLCLAMQPLHMAFAEESLGSTETEATPSALSDESISQDSATDESADKDKDKDKDEEKTDEEKKKALEAAKGELQRQMEVALQTLSNLSSEAELAEYDLLTVTAELDEINAHIDELDEQIPEVKEQLEAMREELSSLVAQSYKEGTPTLLDLLMDVTSFEEMVTRVEYANRVSAYESEVVSQTKELDSKLVQQRADLELEKIQQEQLVEEQKQRVAAVEAAVSSMQAYYNQLSTELQDMIAAEQESLQAANEEAAREALAQALRIAEEQGATNYAVNLPVSPTDNVAGFVARAFSIIGAGYQWSGYTWLGSIRGSAFTCSGVIDFARGFPSRSSSPETLYAEVGSRLVTDTNLLQYGDLVFYDFNGRHPGHVGIYIGGGSIIDSIPNGGVSIRDVNYMPCIGGGPIF